MSALLTSQHFFPTPTTRYTMQIDLERVSGDRWRVHDHRSARILGHIRMEPTPQGVRVIAERFHVATGAFRTLGEFWRADDAIETLRSFG